MIVWALAGIAIGLVAAKRLRVESLGAVLLTSIVLPIAAFVLARRLDPNLVFDYLVFWLSVQGSYLAGGFLAERRSVAAEADAERRRLGEV
mgnify:CR=1 FL=1